MLFRSVAGGPLIVNRQPELVDQAGDALLAGPEPGGAQVGVPAGYLNRPDPATERRSGSGRVAVSARRARVHGPSLYGRAVRGLLGALREDQGLARDPYAAFKESGYLAKIAAERVGGNQAGWGA